MLLGTNGENWFDAADSVSTNWVIDSVLPGQTFTLRFRADKPDFKETDIDKLIELNTNFLAAGKTLAVIYCANIKEDPTLQADRILTLIKEVDIVAVEFGNETYSKEQANFDFEVYKNWFEPLKNILQISLPEMKFLVFLAPRPKESGVLGGRGDHSSFNNAAIAYIKANTNCHPTIHIYFNTRECPIRNTAITKVSYDPNMYYPDLDSYYTTLVEQARSNYSLWDKTLDYMESFMPGKEIYITEWGFDNYGDVKNTFGTGVIAWEIWNKYGRGTRITALLQHNGMSMAGPGMIFPVHPTNDTSDPEGSKNKKRVDYYIYKMFRMISDIPVIMEDSLISAPGIYTKVYTEKVSPVLTLTDDLEYDITSEALIYDSEYMGANKLYESAGATEWMVKNSIPSYIVFPTNTITPTSLTLGFSSVTIKKKEVNKDPIADAFRSTDIIYPGETITLDGTTSYDADGTIVKYEWDFLSTKFTGSVVRVATTSNIAPGTLKGSLTVTDDKGASNTCEFVVIVAEKPCVKPWWCVFLPNNKKCKC